MLFNLSKLFYLFLIFQQFQFSNAADEVRFITSDGVVYSYAVVTSTIKPATVIVRTSTYTTTRVKAITLDNNQVTSTTEEITTQATLVSSVDAESEQQASNSVVAPAAATTSASTIVSSSVVQPVADISSQVQKTSNSPQEQPTETAILSGSPSSSSIKALVQTQNMEGVTRSTSTLTPSITTSSTGTTSITSISSSTSSSSYSLATVSTTEVEDGTCFVYYDDPEDEYYSTAYITDSSQTIDAATTLTSTQTIFATMTLM